MVDGKRVIYVLRNGKSEMVNVTLGLSSDTYSELVSNSLQEGDQIILNPPSTFNFAGGPPRGGMSGGN
jgi:HlyD family secretion protein